MGFIDLYVVDRRLQFIAIYSAWLASLINDVKTELELVSMNKKISYICTFLLFKTNFNSFSVYLLRLAKFKEKILANQVILQQNYKTQC